MNEEGLICKSGEGYGYLFAKFPFVSFISVRYKSDGLYCKKKKYREKK